MERVARYLPAGASLCAGLRAFWALRGSLREGVSWGERFLALPGVPDAARLRLLGALLPLLRMAGGWDPALDYAQEALALLDRADDLLVRAAVQAVVGLAELDRGDHARARAHLADCLTTTRRLGNHYLQAMTLCNLGHASLYGGDVAGARECYVQAYQLAQHEQAELTVADARYGLAVAATLADDPVGEAQCQQALPVLHGFGFLLLIVQSLEVLAAQAGLRGGQIWKAAAHLRAQHQLAVAPGTTKVYRRLADRARGPIDEQGWEQAQATGRALTLDQAVALAMGSA